MIQPWKVLEAVQQNKPYRPDPIGQAGALMQIKNQALQGDLTGQAIAAGNVAAQQKQMAIQQDAQVTEILKNAKFDESGIDAQSRAALTRLGSPHAMEILKQVDSGLDTGAQAAERRANAAAKPQATAADLLRAQTGKTTADTEALKAKTAAEAGFEVPQGGTRVRADGTVIYASPAKETQIPVDQQELADYLKNNPGKGPADFLKFKSDLSGGNSDEVVIQYSENGENKTGLLNKKTRKISEIKTPGTGGTAGPKLAEPPAAVKQQGSAAMTALKQVDNIESIIAANPQLIGPIAGRFEQFMLGVGSNPFAGTKDERLGATLAEHLNALFAQELRSMFPGRTNEQMQALIKSTSAQLKQNPNMMLGILDGIRRNEGMVLETAKGQGFVEDRKAGTPSSATPKIGDTKKFPNGKIGKWDGQGWVAQ